MVKNALGRGAALLAVLLALALVLGCSPPVPPIESEEGKAVSVEELLSDFGSLERSGAKVLVPGGQSFQDLLGLYLVGVKDQFAQYVRSLSAEPPYLVMPVRLRSGGQSGLLWVPVSLGRRLSVPLVSFQHGTQINRNSAPSRFNANPLALLSGPDLVGGLQNYAECLTGALMASAGYIVVMPDYPGFGDSAEPHPYVHLSLGDSVRRMVACAEAVLGGPFAAARPNGRLYLIGYSEGGFATMAAARSLGLAGRVVTAAVPCAGSYDLSGAMLADVLKAEKATIPYYLPYTVFGYASVYEGKAVDGRTDPPGTWAYPRLLKAPLPAWLPQFFGGAATGSAIAAAIESAFPTGVARDMLTDELLAELAPPAEPSGAVYARLKENTIFHRVDWMPTMPVQPVHCETDDIVPYANAEALHAAYAARGLYNVLPPIKVPPLPMAEDLADIHLRAFPTAMLAGFAFIEGYEARF